MDNSNTPKESQKRPSLFCRWYQNNGAAQKALRRTAALAEFEPDVTGHREMPLCRMEPGEFGHVLGLSPDTSLRAHLLELGFTPGVEVRILRVAPLGDPMTVLLRGYQLSLRRGEAEAVRMRRCPPELDPEMND